MKDGRRTEAKEILEEVLSTFPSYLEAHQVAVGIYVLGRMYGEAKAVLARYKEATSEDLPIDTDFDLEHIEQEEQAVEAERERYRRSGSRVFHRIPLKERLRRYEFVGDDAFLSLIPIREIEVRGDQIVLRRGRKEFAYLWSELQDPVIVKKFIEGRPMDYMRHIFRARTPGGMIRFSLTPAYPVYENWEELAASLRKYLPVREKVVEAIPERTASIIVAIAIVVGGVQFYLSCRRMR
jgi:hypothetical protein